MQTLWQSIGSILKKKFNQIIGLHMDENKSFAECEYCEDSCHANDDDLHKKNYANKRNNSAKMHEGTNGGLL